MDDALERRRALRARCREIHWHGKRRPAALLAEVAEWCAANDVEFDAYGTGALIEGFQDRVAELLGFEAARFFPSGTMAQQVALRVWSERSGHPHVGMHATSHLELHEERGYERLHGLSATLVGDPARPIIASDLPDERLSALLVELPLREIGGQLPMWDELQALVQAAGERDIRLHLDGARLWECAPFYERDLAAICAGFDSVYVSFYKGIGALPGAMLLGPRDFIEEAAVWQRRSGGTLFTLAPNVASAAMQLDDRLAKMERYHHRACSLAERLSAVDGVSLRPSPPQVNMMHVHLDMTPDEALRARDRVAEESGLWLFTSVREGNAEHSCFFELYVGDATLAVDDDAIAAAFRSLFE